MEYPNSGQATELLVWIQVFGELHRQNLEHEEKKNVQKMHEKMPQNMKRHAKLTKI